MIIKKIYTIIIPHFPKSESTTFTIKTKNLCKNCETKITDKKLAQKTKNYKKAKKQRNKHKQTGDTQHGKSKRQSRIWTRLA